MLSCMVVTVVCMLTGLRGEVATVTSKSTVTIPARIREKYGIVESSKVKFVESEQGAIFVPLKSLRELRGSLKAFEGPIRQGVRELERGYGV